MEKNQTCETITAHIALRFVRNAVFPIKKKKIKNKT